MWSLVVPFSAWSAFAAAPTPWRIFSRPDRKSTRLNSSHMSISYAVFCLKKKNDYESGQVGAQVAELLGMPVVSNVVDLTVDDHRAVVRRDMEDGYQTVETPLPAVVLASTGFFF